MQNTMNLVVTGSLASGFRATAFLGAAKAEQLARTTLAGGKLAEAIDVDAPDKNKLLSRARPTPNFTSS
ncbi:hypothetical protein [Paraburkholderia youngii]|uniref:hypothetical protein n=1 Tax=Paraburkholderia youngii TaxID=2782701 RepID=UPI003D19F30C